MTFFLLRARFVSGLDKFFPVGILSTDGVNIIYKDIPNGIDVTPFITKGIEKLRLKYRDKAYTYRDEPKLFLELLVQHFAGFLTSRDEFHPLFMGCVDGSAEEVATKVSNRLALFGTNHISSEDLFKIWPRR